ncbi:MAG TPA: branched-chain amino acid ABC transporter permease [Pararhizobium sp.]|nr:branched-chain amino acid ABC transporter permease [Pararhizobium sp.]
MTLSSLQTNILRALRAMMLLGVVALAFGPAYLDIGQLRFFAQIYSLLVLVMMWNLLAGYADIVTVGQHAFVGIGSYALYAFTAKTGFDVPTAIIAAGVLSFLIGIPITAVVFRMRAAYLAIGTWVVAEVCTLLASKIPGFGGATGITLPSSVIHAVGETVNERFANLYWMTLGLAVVCFVATALLLRSRIGLGLMAMRDNEEAAGSVGVNLVLSRIVCFLWTALFLGLAGALITLQNLRIQPRASFSLIDYTVYVIFAVVIGGIGSIEGSIIGVVVYVGLRSYFSDYGNFYLIFLGAISILIMLVEPRGIWGLVRRFLSEDVIPISHRYRKKTEASPAE